MIKYLHRFFCRLHGNSCERVTICPGFAKVIGVLKIKKEFLRYYVIDAERGFR
jgi:hypothetical protein